MWHAQIELKTADRDWRGGVSPTEFEAEYHLGTVIFKVRDATDAAEATVALPDLVRLHDFLGEAIAKAKARATRLNSATFMR